MGLGCMLEEAGCGQQGATCSKRMQTERASASRWAQLGGLLSMPADAGAQWAREQWRLPFKYFKITYKGRIKRSEIPFNRTNKEITIYSISLEKASWMGFPPLKKEKGKEGGKKKDNVCLLKQRKKYLSDVGEKIAVTSEE